MSEPHDFERRVLLAATGLTPQVVTETLYALAIARLPPWIPTEIQIITTKDGADRVLHDLPEPSSGWFHRFRRDYSLPELKFSSEQLVVLRRDDGQPMTDIQTVEDNTKTADVITKQVRSLTDDHKCALHVSIAGGRKTMGFYAGSAISFYGQSQDRLSHILVDARLESNPEFFYPCPRPRGIESVGNGTDRHTEIVRLAEIPFVRMRDGLQKELLDGSLSYSEAVTVGQSVFPPLKLVLYLDTCEISVGADRLALPPSQFAFFWMLAERARRKRPGLHWSDPASSHEYLKCYGRLVNRFSARYEAAQAKLGAGLAKTSFEPKKAQINRRIVERLGWRRAKPYLIATTDRVPRTRYSRFGLTLKPDVIRITARGTES